MKTYTEQELIKKYKSKFIDTISHYDYSEKVLRFSIRSVKNKIHEDHNTPEDEVEFAKQGLL